MNAFRVRARVRGRSTGRAMVEVIDMAQRYGDTSSRRGLAIGIVVALIAIGAVAYFVFAGGGDGGGSGAGGGYAAILFGADRVRSIARRIRASLHP